MEFKTSSPTEEKTTEFPGRSGPVLSILVVNYNSADFIKHALVALELLSKNPFEVFICDNGSNSLDLLKLRESTALYPNVHLFLRTQSAFGSMGHGEALNYLAQFVNTPYAAIMDADCLPLMPNWDQFLIEKLDYKTKIAGTPVAPNGTNLKKPTDFPLMFLCLFETAAFKSLSIDFRPKDIAAGEDTGWELRKKYLDYGFEGFTLYGLNTRAFKQGPFGKSICDEYYTDSNRTQIFCSHLGRGSSPRSGKYRRNWKSILGHAHLYEKDKNKWLLTFRTLLAKSLAEGGSENGTMRMPVMCPACGESGKVTIRMALPTLSMGIFDACFCNRCGTVFSDANARLSHSVVEFLVEKSRYANDSTLRLPIGLEMLLDAIPLIEGIARRQKMGQLIEFNVILGNWKNLRLSMELMRKAGWHGFTLFNEKSLVSFLGKLGYTVERNDFLRTAFIGCIPAPLRESRFSRWVEKRITLVLPGCIPELRRVIAKKNN